MNTDKKLSVSSGQYKHPLYTRILAIYNPNDLCVLSSCMLRVSHMNLSSIHFALAVNRTRSRDSCSQVSDTERRKDQIS